MYIVYPPMYIVYTTHINGHAHQGWSATPLTLEGRVAKKAVASICSVNK